MFQDEYEITNPKLVSEFQQKVDKWLERFDRNDIDRVIAESWLVDWLWQEMKDRSAERNKHARYLWYRGVSMGELSKRTGISKGRISKIIHGSH